MSNHYPYRFVQKIRSRENAFLKYKLLYTFKSPKSHQWYWVWVEAYNYHLYAVKFHLKAHRNSPNKYNIMTGLNEARPLVCTCIAIMLEIANHDTESSFGFIGANMQGEAVANTKRYAFYSNMMATFFSQNIFKHYRNDDKSAYMLIRKSQLEMQPDLLDNIQLAFTEMYDFFE